MALTVGPRVHNYKLGLYHTATQAPAPFDVGNTGQDAHCSKIDDGAPSRSWRPSLGLEKAVGLLKGWTGYLLQCSINLLSRILLSNFIFLAGYQLQTLKKYMTLVDVNLLKPGFAKQDN